MPHTARPSHAALRRVSVRPCGARRCPACLHKRVRARHPKAFPTSPPPQDSAGEVGNRHLARTQQAGRTTTRRGETRKGHPSPLRAPGFPSQVSPRTPHPAHPSRPTQGSGGIAPLATANTHGTDPATLTGRHRGTASARPGRKLGHATPHHHSGPAARAGGTRELAADGRALAAGRWRPGAGGRALAAGGWRPGAGGGGWRRGLAGVVRDRRGHERVLGQRTPQKTRRHQRRVVSRRRRILQGMLGPPPWMQRPASSTRQLPVQSPT